MTDFDPQAWLELGRANLDTLPEGVVLPAPQIDYERYRAVLQKFYDASISCCDVAPYDLDDTDRAQIQGLLAVADEVIALRDWGWIDWYGGKCPVPPSTEVEVRLRRDPEHPNTNVAAAYYWHHAGPPDDHDIVAYRIVEKN